MTSAAPVAEARMPWAVQPDRSARSSRARGTSTIWVGAPAGAPASRAVARARHPAGAGAEHLAPVQHAVVQGEECFSGRRVRVPDAEQVSGAEVARRPLRLRRVSAPQDEPNGVDVSFVESPERQAGPPDQTQRHGERRCPVGRGAPTGAIVARQGRPEKSLRRQRGDVLVREGPVLVQPRRTGGDGREQGAQPFEWRASLFRGWTGGARRGEIRVPLRKGSDPSATPRVAASGGGQAPGSRAFESPRAALAGIINCTLPSCTAATAPSGR
ncbi:MAG: hypothetical protein AVDCRST_MAG04-982 [uncultured Acetobacteraceae bacterium]|uniref:Uncharacterized protein n=1 Tax=uncultured Acetobacteraceae bacterium TaxID=169975 RepID=A0A6J4HN06_9PROT|nr:MAG: hypothetical protein AVDCRST_MAG04-982 [uncultured Acetobacteraceae bacterium]